jgi:hypothetical protein
MHFDMVPNQAGSISVSTTPEGADVYVDYADASAGISPVVIGNLAPGSHVVLLRKAGCLQPRPIIGWIGNQMTNSVSVPLAPDSRPNRLVADVRSVEPGAVVYVDYLPTTNVTDIVIDNVDAASHSGAGWRSASHTVMLRKSGSLPSAPRYIPDETNVTHLVALNLVADVEAARDDDHDGLPDQWEEAYGLPDFAPQKSGADDDPDGDGATNEEELRAGTNPVDGDSVFDIGEMKPEQHGNYFSITFSSVPGRSYVVFCADSLQEGWVQASGVITAGSYQTTWYSPVSGSKSQFYRVIVLQ